MTKRTEGSDGNEPAPLMIIALALIPLLAVGGWLLGLF
jgi:hypothetical protein